MLLIAADGISQASFNTGALEVNINQYGRVRLFTPDGTRHLQRASILVATAPTAVFDYNNDAEELEATALVSNPMMSDFELYGSVDNSYSGAPPAVVVRHNAYGWTNEAYTILKFTIESAEAASIEAMAGLDIIPELEQTYGFDSVSYNSDAMVVRFHRGADRNMGMKLLSSTLSSLYSFEWYDGYTVDEDYYNWMNYGSLMPLYASNTADGPVTISAQGATTLAPGESFEVYYAFAVGADEQEMLANIDEAVQKYHAWFAGVDEQGISESGLTLAQNRPNPVRNTTTINYELPSDGFVTLKVYDLLGTEVATLVSAVQAKGPQSVVCDASTLSNGIYFCRLSVNDEVRAIKITVNK